MEDDPRGAPGTGEDRGGRMGPDDAAAALGAVGELRRVALTRGLPPRWLGGAIASIIGVAGALKSFGASPTSVLLVFAAIFPLVWFKRRTLMAVARRSSYGFSFKLVGVQFVAVVFLTALMTAGEVGRTGYGFVWAPVAAGAAVAVTVYGLFEYKRATFAASIPAVEEGSEEGSKASLRE